MLYRFSRHIVEFKDHCLPKIIDVAFRILGKVHNRGENDIIEPQVESELRKTILGLILESLKYDFLGIKYRMEDDSHEEFVNWDHLNLWITLIVSNHASYKTK